MKHKLLALIFTVSILFTGCQLAREDMSKDANEDNLIGMFITTEYLDLFDFEGYLNANINRLGGGEIKFDDASASKHQGRIYAQLKEISLTNEETGEKISHWDYVFEGLEGSSCFIAKVVPPNGGEPYIASILDGVISDSGTHIYSSDDEEKWEVSATLYVSPSATERTYYLNPVYQSADNSVYLLSGTGFTIGNWNTSEGMQYAQSLESETTVTENGKEKSQITRVELTVSLAFAPEKISVLQMSANNEIISRQDYTPGLLPETLTPKMATEYLIIETKRQDSGTKPNIAREIFSKESETFESFYTRDDGVCAKMSTGINWR